MPASSTTKSKKTKSPLQAVKTASPKAKKTKPRNLCVLENVERVDVVEAERLIIECKLEMAKLQRMLLAAEYAHQMKWYMLRQKYALPEEMTFNRETGMVTEKAKEKASG
jgi:hypothetical protein